MNHCIYCGIRCESNAIRCVGCGAQIEEAEADNNEKPRYEKGLPFAYNGLIVFCNRIAARDEYEFMFYSGEFLLKTLRISGQLMQEMSLKRESIMDIVWQLLESAIGTREQIIIKNNKEIIPTTFHVYAETPIKHLWRGND